MSRNPCWQTSFLMKSSLESSKLNIPPVPPSRHRFTAGHPTNATLRRSREFIVFVSRTTFAEPQWDFVTAVLCHTTFSRPVGRTSAWSSHQSSFSRLFLRAGDCPEIISRSADLTTKIDDGYTFRRYVFSFGHFFFSN